MLLVKVAVSTGTRDSVAELPDTDPNTPPAPSASAAATVENKEVVRRRYLWVADFAISFIMSPKADCSARFSADAGVFGGVCNV